MDLVGLFDWLLVHITFAGVVLDWTGAAEKDSSSVASATWAAKVVVGVDIVRVRVMMTYV